MLQLHEKFILLALDQKKGKFLIDAMALHYGLAGAILLELSKLNKLDVRNKKIVVKDIKLTNSAIIDASLKLINASKKNRKPRYWIYKLGNKSSGFKKIILKDLSTKKYIRISVKEILRGLIKVRRYYKINTTEIDEIKEQMRNAVRNGSKPDTDVLLLLSLISSVKLIRILFKDKKEHRIAKKKINELTKNIEIGEAVSQTLKEIQAAIVVATSSTFVGG